MNAFRVVAGCFLMLLSGCASWNGAHTHADPPASWASITIKGQASRLLGIPVQVGQPLPSTVLVDAITMKKVDLAQMKGKVLLLSIVPSLDTKVCEAQTHYLGEQGEKLPADIIRVTVSRDTPFAQKLFAEEAKLKALTYLSDYRESSFGRATGLLVEENMLLARTIIIVDKDGIVRYLQIVPELSNLPNMDEAFKYADDIAKRKNKETP